MTGVKEAKFNIEEFRNILVQLTVQPVEVLEHERLEIKGWCNDERQLAEKIVEAAACLANAQGGIVLLGIDEGPHKFSASPFPNVNAAWIEARVKDNTIPAVECDVYDLSDLLADARGVGGANAFGLTVPRTKHLAAHLTTKGISKIRVGKECRPYFTSADDDRTRATKQDVTTDDLSLTSINWAIAQHQRKFKTGVLSEDPFEFLSRARLVEPFLADMECVPRYRITLAALILFGKETALARTIPFFETIVKARVQPKQPPARLREPNPAIDGCEIAVSYFGGERQHGKFQPRVFQGNELRAMAFDIFIAPREGRSQRPCGFACGSRRVDRQSGGTWRHNNAVPGLESFVSRLQ